MQKRDDTDQIQAEAAWERTHFSQSIDTRHQQSIDTLPHQSIDTNNTTSIDNRPIPKTNVSEQAKLDNQYLTPYEFGIFRDPDSYAKAIDVHYTYLEKISQISFRQPMEQTILSCINAATQNRRLQGSSMTQLVA
ncbi:hypothetical protein F2Q69_00035494 [Brassica cretica]|uniref:Uncharacterized protein n=1 Tax=Brassica cretica TaxID=69181 RepID=A0A8S9SGN8_BRACR|nr:hypothetical protein F2Q69_00035494 [Brassica cretica]